MAEAPTKAEVPKILLLDDDPRVLEMYATLLDDLPSRPVIRTANSGARALAMLEAEPYSLLLCDLHMPQMDGLQVLAIVRRKFPQLRTAVLTGLTDPQFRTRAYAMGLDLYLEKPTTPQGVKLLLDCVESLLGQSLHGGFRGMESKSLADIIQLECLCRSSSVLKIANGLSEGRIWFQEGEVFDATTPNQTGEAAFKEILTWKKGSFEILPAEPGRPRAIRVSTQNMLLESAQSLDEAQVHRAAPAPTQTAPAPAAPLKSLSQFEGVEFGLVIDTETGAMVEACALENPAVAIAWTRNTLEQFRELGTVLQVGALGQVSGSGPQHQVLLAMRGNQAFCVGFSRAHPAARAQATLNSILAQWDD